MRANSGNLSRCPLSDFLTPRPSGCFPPTTRTTTSAASFILPKAAGGSSRSTGCRLPTSLLTRKSRLFFNFSPLAVPARLGYNPSAIIQSSTGSLPTWRSLDGWLANYPARIAARKHVAPRRVVGRNHSHHLADGRIQHLRDAARV